MPSSTLTKTTFHDRDEHFNTSDHTSKSMKRMYYPSNKKGAFVVNAITGSPYKWRSGSVESLRLFRVVDASGKCDNMGYYDRRGNHGNTFNKEPNILYYDGPNEYMKHRKTNVPATQVNEWNTTREELFSGEGGELNYSAYQRLKNDRRVRATLNV